MCSLIVGGANNVRKDGRNNRTSVASIGMITSLYDLPVSFTLRTNQQTPNTVYTRYMEMIKMSAGVLDFA